MSTVGIVLAYRGGENVPAIRTDGRAATPITSSGASQASSITAADSEYWVIGTTGNIWVTFAAAPVAAAGTKYLLTAGVHFFEAIVGDKCAVIDAS